MKAPPRAPLPLLVTAVCLAATPAGAAEFPPPGLENVQELREDMPVPELIGVMKGFTAALGVRCPHCHVGNEGEPLTSFDFASDDKEAKRVARAMIAMTREINGRLLDATGRPAGERVEVQCVTCHRGQARPRLIEAVLGEALAEGGVDAAIARYGELRSTYHGSHTFDFGERVLPGLADGLAAAGDPDGALRLLDLNLEHHPGSQATYFSRSRLLEAKGDLAGAIEAVERGIAVDPESDFAGWLRKRLEELRAASEPDQVD